MEAQVHDADSWAAFCEPHEPWPADTWAAIAGVACYANYCRMGYLQGNIVPFLQANLVAKVRNASLVEHKITQARCLPGRKALFVIRCEGSGKMKRKLADRNSQAHSTAPLEDSRIAKNALK